VHRPGRILPIMRETGAAYHGRLSGKGWLMAPISVVVFDLGETLLSEDRAWASWADWLGVPRLTFAAVLGAVIERGQDHREVFGILRPGFDFERERARKEAAGPWALRRDDLYPDALPCLDRLWAAGLRVGIAANQPAHIEGQLAGIGLHADFVASSGRWGVAKPAAAFFDRVVAEAGVPAGEIAYVGDRADNDVIPARAAGLFAVWLRRGPWGFIQAAVPGAVGACVGSLAELPGVLGVAV
jgi:FMN phosphatase YigB (HAD superfamily)